MERITLYFRQGSSDKVYQASIEPADGAYAVRFAYGRGCGRGVSIPLRFSGERLHLSAGVSRGTRRHPARRMRGRTAQLQAVTAGVLKQKSNRRRPPALPARERGRSRLTERRWPCLGLSQSSQPDC